MGIPDMSGKLTAEKLAELSEWALQHRVEPGRCPSCGWEYYGMRPGKAECGKCGEEITVEDKSCWLGGGWEGK